MQTYSMDLRERVVAAYDRKTGTQAEVAARFEVSLSWLQKLLRFRRAAGSIAPKPHGGGWTPKFTGERLEELKKFVEEDPGATLEELLERSKVDASIMAVQRALLRLDCHRKKSRSTPLSRIARRSKPSAINGANRLRN
jgi:transposase